jgi:hypothetical protein
MRLGSRVAVLACTFTGIVITVEKRHALTKERLAEAGLFFVGRGRLMLRVV